MFNDISDKSEGIPFVDLYEYPRIVFYFTQELLSKNPLDVAICLEKRTVASWKEIKEIYGTSNFREWGERELKEVMPKKDINIDGEVNDSLRKWIAKVSEEK